jgi:hypothetical protein
MKKYLVYFSIYLSYVFLFNSCVKQDEYPIVPQIDFTQVIINDTLDKLGNKVFVNNIYFKVLDGDGNFGLKSDDTIIDYYGDSIYLYNFFATLYYINNGQVIEYEPTMDLNTRIPYSEPISVTKFYKSIVIFKTNAPPFITYPIKYSFYVLDRNLNKSNIQSTPWIIPNTSGVLTDTITIIPD